MEENKEFLTPSEQEERKNRRRYRSMILLIALDILFAIYLIIEIISAFSS